MIFVVCGKKSSCRYCVLDHFCTFGGFTVNCVLSSWPSSCREQQKLKLKRERELREVVASELDVAKDDKFQLQGELSKALAQSRSLEEEVSRLRELNDSLRSRLESVRAPGRDAHAESVSATNPLAPEHAPRVHSVSSSQSRGNSIHSSALHRGNSAGGSHVHSSQRHPAASPRTSEERGTPLRRSAGSSLPIEVRSTLFSIYGPHELVGTVHETRAIVSTVVVAAFELRTGVRSWLAKNASDWATL